MSFCHFLAQIMNPERRSGSEDRLGGHFGTFAPALTTLVEGQVDSFRRSNQSIGPLGPHPGNLVSSGRGRLSASLGSTDTQGMHFFPSNADLLTSAEQTPRTSYQGRLKVSYYCDCHNIYHKRDWSSI